MVKNLTAYLTGFIKESFYVRGKNLAWINLARGFIIIMVVLRHSFEGVRNAGLDVSPYKQYELLNNVMYTFRMPLFFVISGILMNLSLKKSGLNTYIQKRAQYILYPYVIWCCIQISLQLLLPQFVNDEAGWRSFLSILYNPRDLEQFWYLYALFNIMVIYSLLKVKLRLNPLIHLAIALTMFLVAENAYNNGIKLYFLYDIFAHYIFFATGDLLSKYVLDEKNRKKISSVRSLLLVLPFFIGLHYYYVINPSIASTPFILLVVFSGIVTALIVSFLLQDVKGLQWVKVLGANSLYIYLMHVMVMAANRVFILRILDINSVPLVLASNLVLGLLIPILAYNFLVRIGCWWLFTPFKPTGQASLVHIPVKQVKQLQ